MAQNLLGHVCPVPLTVRGKQGTSFTSIEFGGESLRGLGLVDERSLGTIAQRQMRIRDRARRVVAAQLDTTRSDQDVADLAERLARLDTATAVTIAARDHLIATGEAPSSPLTPPAPPSASSKNGAKAPNPKSPAHAARRASGVLQQTALEGGLQQTALEGAEPDMRRPPMIRVDTLTQIRPDN